MDASLADYLRAIFLGLLQALTEFLPISSSGHLVLAPHLIGDQVSSLTFDVGLHIGTLFAVLIYFWRDWTSIAVSLLADLPRHRAHVGRWSEASRLGLWIVVATVPAVIVGALLKDTLEHWFRAPVAVGVSLLFWNCSGAVPGDFQSTDVEAHESHVRFNLYLPFVNILGCSCDLSIKFVV